jgi:hypothetical protein
MKKKTQIKTGKASYTLMKDGKETDVKMATYGMKFDHSIPKGYPDLSKVFKKIRKKSYVCTEIADELQETIFKKRKTVVMGYSIYDNTTAKIGEDEEGHDFLVVDGKYIVDLWYRDYYEKNFPFYFPIERASELYGNPKLWVKSGNDFVEE